MDLEHIKDEQCPTCGAITQSEERKNRHCGGQWNEYRVFACGLDRKS